ENTEQTSAHAEATDNTVQTATESADTNVADTPLNQLVRSKHQRAGDY
ncbi:hypothetical protein VINI7043_26160, partial [Vibrio nigripulchritudo ATCC 27043]